MQRNVLIIFTMLWIAACGGSKPLMKSVDGSYDYYDLKRVIDQQLSKPAVLHIGDVEIACTITGFESDRLIIKNGDLLQEIPVRAISKIEIQDLAKKFLSTSATSLIGGGLGWLAGRGITSEVLANKWEKFKSNDKQVAAAIAGATIGFVAGAILASKRASNSIDLNPRVEPLVLDRAVGAEITQGEVRKYGLFDDVQTADNESLAQVKVVQYGPTEYLLLYDTFVQKELPKYAYDGREMTVKIPAAEMKTHWQVVTRDYLVRQQDKIQKQLKSTNEDLKYKFFEQ